MAGLKLILIRQNCFINFALEQYNSNLSGGKILISIDFYIYRSIYTTIKQLLLATHGKRGCFPKRYRPSN